VALGKILFYTILCTVQFFVMCAIGLWILPIFDLPALNMGTHAWVLLPLSICIAMAATAYGYFVGSVFKTTNQAMPFGAISVVILSAMGGIWVPMDILPQVMQRIAMISPLHWGLDGINQVILRNGSIDRVILHMCVLVVFSIVLWLISLYVNRDRQHSI
jgi:ABC-2 type transport system permease protein